MPNGRPSVGGVAYRIRQSQYIVATIQVMATGGSSSAVFEVEFDDGTYDVLSAPPVSLSSLGDFFTSTKACPKNGWIVSGYVLAPSTDIQGANYCSVYIAESSSQDVNTFRQCLMSGYLEFNQMTLGTFQRPDFVGTWVFQGTIAEDATVGTHVCTLTVTPGAGNALEIVAGRIIVGNTATAQTASVEVDDGTNTLYDLLNPDDNPGTIASNVYDFPTGSASTGLLQSTSNDPGASWGAFKLSGTMRIILKVSTAAVSVTQTFALVCRLKGTDLPTATLADTVGTPTLTTNTSALI